MLTPFLDEYFVIFMTSFKNSITAIESLSVIGSDVDNEQQKKENVKDTFSSPESLANVSAGSISKHKSFSGSIKGSLRKRQTSQVS